MQHEHFANLDKKWIIIDDNLEKDNFQHAGETLAKVGWEMKIYNYVSGEYRKPEDSL